MIPPKSKMSFLSSVSIVAVLAIAGSRSALAACNPTGTNQTCTNNATIDGNTSQAIYDTGKLNLTNTAAGIITGKGGVDTVRALDTLVLDNAGSISNTYAGISAAVDSAGDATVVNRATGYIEGSSSNGGMALTVGGPTSGTLALSNDGFIGADTGVWMHNGTIKNFYGGIIAGSSEAVYAIDHASAIVNWGQIYSNATGGRGVVLANGGSVTNYAGGVIRTASGPSVLGESTTAHVGVYNEGEIKTVSGSDAIFLAGDGSDVTNRAGGLISGFRYGIKLGSGDYTITNAGTISGQNGGAIFADGRVTIDNSGVIQSTTAGIYGVQSTYMVVTNRAGGQISAQNTALLATDTLTLANYGTVRSVAGYALSAGAVDVQNMSGGVIDGGIYHGFNIDNAGLIVSGGTAVTMGNLTSARVDNHAGGTIRGVNAGISVNASGNTITNSGVIEATNSYSAIVYKSGVSGEVLNINPGASFVGGMNWNNNIDNTIHFGAGSYTVGVKSYLLDKNSIFINKPSQILTTNLDANGTGTLIVTDTGGAAALASVPGAVMTTVFSTVDDVLDMNIDRPGAWAKPKAGAAAPMAYADMPSEAAKRTGAVLVDDQTAIDGLGNLVWLRAGGTFASRSAAGGQTDQWSHVGTLTVGADRMFDDWRFGVLVGGGLGASGADGGSAKVQSDLGFGGIYGRTSFGDMTLDAALLAGGLSARSERQISGLTGRELATGDSHGWFVAPEISLAARYALNSDWFVTPKATVRYAHAGFGAYAEEGSSQNASYDAHGLDRLEERLEVKLTRQSVDHAGLATRLSLAGAIFDTQTIGRTAFAGELLGNEITITPEARKSAFGASLGLGAETQLSRATSLYGTVTGSVDSEHARTVAIKGGFKLAF